MIILSGILMAIDGMWSLVTAYNTHYPACPWYCDAGRLVRAIIGIALIVFSFKLRFEYNIVWA